MKVFIASSSKDLIDNIYLNEMEKVCNTLCQKGYDLVFGAYSKGMMGVCYNTFINNNHKALGYTLSEYQDDLVNISKAEISLTNSSFDRLKMIYNESNLFLIMPGGTGTLAELFGIMEEFKTDNNSKKIILYNYLGFYDDLIKYLEKIKQMNFIIDEEYQKLIIIDNLEKLEEVI